MGWLGVNGQSALQKPTGGGNKMLDMVEFFKVYDSDYLDCLSTDP